MNGRLRGILTVLGMLLVTGLAYVGARYWQAAEPSYRRIAADEACDLRAGPCRLEADGGAVIFSISPTDIPLMQPLHLRVETQRMAVREVRVEVRGLNMDMGLNRTRLAQVAAGRWEGETILPVCSQRRMEWEALVRLDGSLSLELPFLFHTERP